MFDFFRLARYRITISAGRRGLSLPPYKGSVFLGNFGSVFRRAVCSRRLDDCGNCRLKEDCPYAYVFETSPPADAEALRNYENIPRPFVIEPPAETKTEFEPGEKLDFHLLLIGRAIEFLPYFIVVFREMGEAGLGRGRRPFEVEEIVALGLDRQELLYTRLTNTFRSMDLHYTGAEVAAKYPAKASRIRVIFETPVNLKNKGKMAPRPHFHVFFRQAMRRISALSYFHHGRPLEADYAGLAERARRIELVEDYTVVMDIERYSRRQERRIPMGGLVGSVTYRGPLDEFLPWLALGEHVHVGKNTVFGMGKYRLLFPDSRPFWPCHDRH
jgi:hypothetical protein